MKYKDIVGFREELFFDGAVDLDLVLKDKGKATIAASSYIFHSGKSFTNLGGSDNKSIDSIQVINNILYSLYSEERKASSNLMTMIAGYGSGKSHLAVALAALFANNKDFIDSTKVLTNIAEVDMETAKEVEIHLTKPNIVLTFNGMNDFDLRNFLYQQVLKYLEISKVNIPIFETYQQQDEDMRKFIELNFDDDRFQKELHSLISKSEYISIIPKKEFLINNISQVNVNQLICLISKEQYGFEFKSTVFLNPKVILNEVSNKLCGDGKPFDKIIILFDEFGRYIEWLSTQPALGSTIQQLYEGVVENNRNTLFVSFIQFPLSTYFQGLSPTAYMKVAQYAGRFTTSPHYHLSSVLENVFTNLVMLKKEFKNDNFYLLHDKLLKWDSSLEKKHIWADSKLYKEVICKKLSPFHPLTIALLSRLSEFTQKRGPLAILRELMHNYENVDIEIESSIKAVSVMNTSFVDDLLSIKNINHAGKQIIDLYNSLINKSDIKAHLGVEQRTFLKCIVIINLLGLTPNSKVDYYELLNNLSGMGAPKLKEVEEYLEIKLGVINFDTEVFYHHMVLDQIGQREFDSFFKGQRAKLSEDTSYYRPEFITTKLNEVFKDKLQSFSCSLAYSIKTLEWEIPQEIIEFRDNLYNRLEKELTTLKDAIEPNENKAKIVWVYYNDRIEEDFTKIANLIKEFATNFSLEEYPLIIGVLIDSSGVIYDQVLDLDTINNFSKSDKEKYAAFYRKAQNKIVTEIENEFIRMKKDALFYLDGNITKTGIGFNHLVNNRIEEIYPNYIPFNFSGFDVKSNHNGRRAFIQVLKIFIREKIDKEIFKSSFDNLIFNRFMMIAGEYGWNIFIGNQLGKPTNKRVRNLFELVDKRIYSVTESNDINFSDLISFLFKAPNGMNIYSATFLLFYVLYFHKNNIKFVIDNESYNFENWVNFVISDYVEIEKINKTTLKYYDFSKDEELLNNFINRIYQEQEINKILQLWPKIKSLTENENLSLEAKERSAYVIGKVRKAEKFRTTYNNIQKEYDSFLNKNQQNDINTVPEILKSIKELKDNWDELEKNSTLESLILPDVWSYKIRESFSNVKEIVEKNFIIWLKKNKNPQGNIDAFISFSEKIENGLIELGLNRFAQDVRNNVKEIGETVELTSLISEKILEVQNNLNKTDNYAKIVSYRKEIESLIFEINIYEQLTEKQKDNFKASVGEISKEIKKKIKEFDHKIADIWNYVSEEEISNVVELDSFIKKIKLVLEQIDDTHTDYSELKEILENVKTIKTDLEEVKIESRNIEDLENRMARLREKYSLNIKKDPDTVLCGNLFIDFENNLKEEIGLKIKQFMEYFQNVNFEDCCENKLNDYLDYIKAPPSYLGIEEYNEINQIKIKIYSVMENATIDEITRMFELIESRDSKIKLLKALKAKI